MKGESLNAPLLTAARCFAWRFCLAANLFAASFSILGSRQVLSRTERLVGRAGGRSGNATRFSKRISETSEKWFRDPRFPFPYVLAWHACVCVRVCVKCLKGPKRLLELCRWQRLRLCWSRVSVSCIFVPPGGSWMFNVCVAKIKIKFNVAWNISVMKIKAKKNI